ncbi:MAG TPA: sulfurtransferase [Streptosporangiaceae bacterium]|nr:sulfurtransferase [Streptosporangiaceae bacterium]
MSSYLISAVELGDSLSSALVLDARWRLAGPPGVDDYRAGHIPGAVYLDLDRDLSAPPGPGRHPLPSSLAFQASMRLAGVSSGVPVVVYDDGDALPAARAWWLLRYFGHSHVRVLDGGFPAWQRAGLPISVAVPSVPVGDFTARPGGMPLLDADAAAELASGDGVLIDVRTGERYRGETEPIDPVAGHIPGAVNLPISETANGDGTFRSADELAETFAALGVSHAGVGGPHTGVGVPHAGVGVPHAGVGAYCGSGVTAARGVLALAIAGIPAALYVGSWSDWISDPTRPIATDTDTAGR